MGDRVCCRGTADQVVRHVKNAGRHIDTIEVAGIDIREADVLDGIVCNCCRGDHTGRTINSVEIEGGGIGPCRTAA